MPFGDCSRNHQNHRKGQVKTIINMTAYPEGYLARELELCYANIAMVADHDVGVEGGACLPRASRDGFQRE